MSPNFKQFTKSRDAAVQAARRIAQDVAAMHAPDVDAQARFPVESINAMREASLLSAQMPEEMGGAGLGVRQLGDIVSSLAEACASSAMVLAMHYNQLACLLRHGRGNPAIDAFLVGLHAGQWLIASMTSEVGTAGDTRRSVCAVQRDGDEFSLEKLATTGSYCEEADAILVSARRDEKASPGDQVLVLVQRHQRTLERTNNWDTLGMRGTCSPGFRLTASGSIEQILHTPFADIASQSMVPYSHILWSALWTGIAASALGKAAAFVRQQARRQPGSTPPGAGRLAALSADLQAMRHNWEAAADEFDRVVTQDDAAQTLGSMRWALKMNHLKVASSSAAPMLVHGALQVLGVMGYRNDSPFSLSRELRDALSGSLMISNDRLQAASASMLLVAREA